jgi:hypothetical protein
LCSFLDEPRVNDCGARRGSLPVGVGMIFDSILRAPMAKILHRSEMTCQLRTQRPG